MVIRRVSKLVNDQRDCSYFIFIFWKGTCTDTELLTESRILRRTTASEMIRPCSAFHSFWSILPNDQVIMRLQNDASLANFLHPSFSSQKQLTLRKSPSALSAMGFFFLFLLEILCKPLSLPFVLRREALSLTKTTVLLVYHSTFFLLLFFQDLLQTNSDLSFWLLAYSTVAGLHGLNGLPCYRSGWLRSLSQGYQCNPSKRQLDL